MDLYDYDELQIYYHQIGTKFGQIISEHTILIANDSNMTIYHTNGQMIKTGQIIDDDIYCALVVIYKIMEKKIIHQAHHENIYW